MTVKARIFISRTLHRIGIAIVASAFIGTAFAAPSQQAVAISALGIDAQTKVLWKVQKQALLKSSDTGRTWEEVTLPQLPGKAAITEISFQQNGSNGIYVAGPGAGVWISNNAGKTWVDRSKGLPSKNIVALSGHATQPDTVYVYIKNKGIFRSDDSGAKWQLMDKGPRQSIHSFMHSNMPGSMQTGWLFAATSKGVKRSMDCFCGWHDAGSLDGEFIATAYDAKEPKRVYAATINSLYRSEDGGEEWKKIASPGGRITSLVATAAGELFVAANGKVFQSKDQGATWEPLDA